ncbi:hypothetical protein Oscil6304_2663 [Oscillatoria acuminata PCC 6304]|uniref:Uncharacterized protein n=1 Tax=Oscillatoria acuminata PCC 6304 TaxID=56110 RepID=K9THF2_9CYAN|nr:hypothetical protein Oscil6304_2663 [Oscillatoria acuminata PCC 6304]
MVIQSLLFIKNKYLFPPFELSPTKIFPKNTPHQNYENCLHAWQISRFI